MGDLAHHRRAVLVHPVGQLAQPRHDLVLVDVQVAEGGRAVRGDDSGAAHHRQADAALGLLLVVEAVAPLGHAVLGVRRLVRRADDAVAQGHVLQLELLKKRIDELHGHNQPAF